MVGYEMTARYDSRDSFYGKVVILEPDDGSRVLVSYGTPVLKLDADGNFTRLWGGWSAATGRHINEFSLQMTGMEMRKKDYEALPMGAM